MQVRTKKYTTYGKRKERIVQLPSQSQSLFSPQTLPSTLAQRTAKPVSAHALLLALHLSSPTKQSKAVSISSDSEEEVAQGRAALTPIKSNITARKARQPAKAAVPVKKRRKAPVIVDSDQENAPFLKALRSSTSAQFLKSTLSDVPPLAPATSEPLPIEVPIQSTRPIENSQPVPIQLNLPPVPIIAKAEKPTKKRPKVAEVVILPDLLPAVPKPTPLLSTKPSKAALQPLLHACGQDKPYNFTSFVERAQLAGLLGPEQEIASPWRKLCEATYSEVFQTGAEDGRVVIKVIPLLQAGGKRAKNAEIMPQTTELKDALRELDITRLLNDGMGISGFVALHGAHIVQGKYPEELLKQWDRYQERHPQEALNYRPSAFPDTQTYMLLCLPYNGVDLESFKVRSWLQAASILWQIASSLDQAESSCRFEHRDLHWGNVLVKHVPVTASDTFHPINRTETPLRKSLGDEWPAILEPDRSGVQTCIIDYTLSSADGPDGRLFGGLDDDELFEGEGDHQYDVYRSMRRVVQREWNAFHPATNLLWLHYLARKLLEAKGLRPAAAAPTPRRATPTMNCLLLGGPPARKSLAKSRFKVQESRAEKQERQAYEALRRAADGLGDVVDRLLSSDGPAGTEDGESWLDWKSCGDFTSWWAYASLL